MYRGALQLAVQRLQETAESVRSISTHLRPRILDELGAASAVQWFCREFAATYPRLSVNTEITVEDRQVPDRLAESFFPLADGVGLEKATDESRRHGLGLRNLRERAQMTGGKFSITRAPGHGTLAQLSWQLDETERAGADR